MPIPESEMPIHNRRYGTLTLSGVRSKSSRRTCTSWQCCFLIGPTGGKVSVMRSDHSAEWGAVDDGVVEKLRGIVGPEHVKTDDGAVAAFSRDATPLFAARPDVVVLPGSTAEVAAVLRLATERRIPVTPRGAGSNLAAGTLAQDGGIVLVLTRLDRILEVDADELLAVVQTGVTTTELAAVAAQQGLLYVPDPGSKTVSTVGGNVATCAGGLRGLKYGVTRNYVLGLEAVLPTGEIIRTGGGCGRTSPVTTSPGC